MPSDGSPAPSEGSPAARLGHQWPMRAWEFLVHGIVQPRQLRKPYAAIMHLLLFWGVSIQIVGTAINLMQMKLFTPFELTWPRGIAYLVYEVAMEWAGIAILLGVVMAVLRRGVLRPAALESRWDDWYALVLLALVAVVGFGVEGLRLYASQPPWASYSPVGSTVARGYGALGLTEQQVLPLHLTLFWLHAGLGLLFVASIPSTKLRHLVVIPWNLLARPRRPAGTPNRSSTSRTRRVSGPGTSPSCHRTSSWASTLACAAAVARRTALRR